MTKPLSDPYCLCATLEWKLGIHMAEWNAFRELAYRTGKAGEQINRAHFDGVSQLLREYLQAMETYD